MLRHIEFWRELPILGINGYYISTFGNLKSNRQGKENYVISKQTDRDGYLSVTLFCSVEKKRKKFQVHRLVAITFLKNPYNLPEVNHKNGIPDDNHVLNLEWCTSSYNNFHACYFNQSRNQIGENNNCAVLTNDKVLEIYNRVHNGESPKELANIYNVSISTIRNIKSGFRYNKITKHKPIPLFKEVKYTEKDYNDELNIFY